jgi:hypothetical protein
MTALKRVLKWVLCAVAVVFAIGYLGDARQSQTDQTSSHAALLAIGTKSVDDEPAKSALKKMSDQARRGGVLIGMSPSDARASSWGNPDHINRTTTTDGTSEQWVYRGGNLYFRNGVLNAIQN